MENNFYIDSLLLDNDTIFNTAKDFINEGWISKSDVRADGRCGLYTYLKHRLEIKDLDPEFAKDLADELTLQFNFKDNGEWLTTDDMFRLYESSRINLVIVAYNFKYEDSDLEYTVTMEVSKKAVFDRLYIVVLYRGHYYPFINECCLEKNHYFPQINEFLKIER